MGLTRGQRFKTLLAVTWALIATSSFGLLFTENSFPRPVWFFILIGISTVIASSSIFYINKCSKKDTVATLVTLLTIGIWLRLSGFINLLASGGDHQRWLESATIYISQNRVVGEGMYSASPLYILDIALTKVLLGFSIFSTKEISILASCITLLFLFVSTRLITKSNSISLFAVTFGIPQPLFLRTASLIEAEHMALIWFSMLLVVLYMWLNQSRVDFKYLIFAILISSVWLHFFYSLVIVLFTVFVLFIHRIVPREIIFKRRRIGSKSQLMVVALSATLYLVYHILWSVWGPNAVGVLASFLRIELPSNIISILIPTSGTAAQSVGNSGNTSTMSQLLSVTPLMILALLSLIGIVYVLYHQEFVLFLPPFLTLGSFTVVALIATFAYRLQFRLYYFDIVVSISLCAVGMCAILNLLTRHPKLQVVLLVCIIGPYAILGPVSTFGNNVDTPLGTSGEWSTTSSNYQQVDRLDQYISEETGIVENTTDFNIHSLPGKKSEDPHFSLIQRSCERNSNIWTSGRYNLCVK